MTTRSRTSSRTSLRVQTPTWRWTGKRPTVRVRMRSAENLRYTIDFAIAGIDVCRHGSVDVTFLVNDRCWIASATTAPAASISRSRFRPAG